MNKARFKTQKNQMAVLGGVYWLFFTGAASTKLFFSLKEPWGAGEREGVCQTAFICGMVMTLFLQTLSKLSTSCLLSGYSHFCPWNWSTGNELQPSLKSCQETREGWLGDRRRGGGIRSCACWGERAARQAGGGVKKVHRAFDVSRSRKKKSLQARLNLWVTE